MRSRFVLIAQVHRLTGDAGGHVKALGDVAVLGLGKRAAIGVGLGAGQWHALADLDQCGHAFAGLDLLDAAVAAFGADQVMTWIGSGLLIVVTGIDRDQQAFGGCVQLRQQGFAGPGSCRGACLDDQLVAVGADFAVLADESSARRATIRRWCGFAG
jgi:hypothetical protein